MVHWSKNPLKREEVLKKISKNRKGKCLGNQNGFKKDLPSWNKGITGKLSHSYGRPATEKQRKNMQRIGKKSYPTWNKNLREWSPRIRDEILRQFVLERDDFQCTTCKTTEKLVVHHKKHWEQVKDKSAIHKIDNLQTYCRRCHMIKHGKQKKQMIKEVKLKDE